MPAPLQVVVAGDFMLLAPFFVQPHPSAAALHEEVAADERAWERARRPKRCQLVKHPQLRRVVARKLSINWSPEQIASWLKRAYPKDPSYHVSHETIYRSLFVQTRGALKAAGIQTRIGNHTFRATGITAYHRHRGAPRRG